MRPKQLRFSPFKDRALKGQILGIIRGAQATLAQA
jgi:hypothetical protein